MQPIVDAVRAGDPDRALGLAEACVRDDPASPIARSVLADVLIIRGDLERAESHLLALARFDPSREREVESCLQLIRAECDRQQVFSEGRPPEFLLPPTESMRLRLGAIAHARCGEPDRAAKLLEGAANCEAEYLAVASVASERADEVTLAPFLDWDSRFGATVEGMTVTGKYFWIPLAEVSSISLAPVRALRDLIWRGATLRLGTGFAGGASIGNEALLFIPTRYPGSESSPDGAIRCGMATEWDEPAPGIGIGRGQRTFLHGDRQIAAAVLGEVLSAASLTSVAESASEGRK